MYVIRCADATNGVNFTCLLLDVHTFLLSTALTTCMLSDVHTFLLSTALTSHVWYMLSTALTSHVCY